MKRVVLIVIALVALVAGTSSPRVQATPIVSGHCSAPFSSVVYCEYETDPRSELKYITWCLCYNFVTTEFVYRLKESKSKGRAV